VHRLCRLFNRLGYDGRYAVLGAQLGRRQCDDCVHSGLYQHFAVDDGAVVYVEQAERIPVLGVLRRRALDEDARPRCSEPLCVKYRSVFHGFSDDCWKRYVGRFSSNMATDR
jgi:hypothetical protein